MALKPSMRSLADRFMPAGGHGPSGRASFGPEERNSLNAGYARSQREGFGGSLDDFLIDQSALYQKESGSISETDPRFRTWLGDSLGDMMADPTTRARIMARAAAFAAEGSPPSIKGLTQ